MTNTTINKIILSATTAIFLTACGGSSSGNGNGNGNGGAADTTPPVITLTGDATVNLTVGDTYTDAGATATDDVDGDITANITDTASLVSTGTAGTYTITYNVSDAAGNKATATRTVNVQAANAPENNAPVATEQSLTVLEDSSNNEITLAGTDEDNNTLTYAITTQPENGTADLTGNIVKYTPTADFSGEDTFGFTVNDGTVDSAEATVTITVTDVVETISPLKTGQTISYDTDGAPVTDGSLKDNAFYNNDKGVTPKFSRDADTNTTTDELTGLVWQDSPRNQVYVNGIEIDTFCDANEGWRIPTISELKTIVDYSVHTPSVDGEAFKYATATIDAGNYRTTSATTGINFRSGEVKIGDESASRAIRCVKGTSAIVNSFERNATDNTVTDSSRKLVWQDNPTGTEIEERKTWTEAIDYCENLDGGGIWRLPNINELESITDRSKAGKYMNEAFTHVSSYADYKYWTSTTSAVDEKRGFAWSISYVIGKGKSTTETKARANNVRCVKDLAE